MPVGIRARRKAQEINKYFFQGREKSKIQLILPAHFKTLMFNDSPDRWLRFHKFYRGEIHAESFG
jgi:hypothetical protein